MIYVNENILIYIYLTYYLCVLLYQPLKLLLQKFLQFSFDKRLHTTKYVRS